MKLNLRPEMIDFIMVGIDDEELEEIWNKIFFMASDKSRKKIMGFIEKFLIEQHVEYFLAENYYIGLYLQDAKKMDYQRAIIRLLLEQGYIYFFNDMD